MARETTQQQKEQPGSRQSTSSARSTSSTGGTGSTAAPQGARTPAGSGDSERSITTNREQPRQGQGSTGMQRRPASQLSRQGRSDVLDSNPFSLMQRMADDMDRLFEQFGFGRGALALSPALGAPLGRDSWSPSVFGGQKGQGLWAPQVDVLRRGDKLVVRADVPGMKKEDLHVDVEDDFLVIRGERHEEHENRTDGVFRTERSYGEFYRAIPLPDGVKSDACEARYDNGVLEVTLPAPEPERASKRIPIH